MDRSKIEKLVDNVRSIGIRDTRIANNNAHPSCVAAGRICRVRVLTSYHMEVDYPRHVSVPIYAWIRLKIAVSLTLSAGPVIMRASKLQL